MSRSNRGMIRFGPSRSDPHDVVFFRRHPADDLQESEPGRLALNSWPSLVRAKARAVLAAVAAAPPHRFSGGGYWEAMKGQMAGWFEVRIDGRDKPFKSTISAGEYSKVKALGAEYFSRNPRSIS